jgi:hypothetical protein
MPSGTCELSCALKTNFHAICKLKNNNKNDKPSWLAMEKVGNLPTSHDWL